ncbi:MAG: HEAT repeat domain-containing protein [Hymenobacter sp.]|nr:MAG: HEAT repeat domain-containing protein [Hymenobacter sp.]
MAHPREELIRLINLDEPDYPSIVRQLTKDDIPLLTQLAQDPNPGLATKAISCLGLLNDDAAVAGLQAAVAHPDPVYRIAAAHALRNVASSAVAVRLLGKLLDDQDVGVRKFALKSVDVANISSLKEQVRQVNLREQNEGLKTLSQSLLQKLR